MRRFFGHAPPFSPFLIEIFDTGRNMIVEKRKTCSAGGKCAESG